MSAGRSDPHDIAFTAPARRPLQRIPQGAATAAVELIYGDLAANPHQIGRPLRFDLDGLHAARRGDFRIDDEAHRVIIMRIAHRSDAYRT